MIFMSPTTYVSSPSSEAEYAAFLPFYAALPLLWGIQDCISTGVGARLVRNLVDTTLTIQIEIWDYG